MSVVVRMEMPQDGVCDGCDARFIDFLAGPMCAIKKKFLGSSRPSWCPIICSLPEGHGRLVDADKLKAKKYHSDIAHENAVAVAEIDWAETIVPAERSET